MIHAVERYPILAQIAMLFFIVVVSVLGGLAVVIWQRYKRNKLP